MSKVKFRSNPYCNGISVEHEFNLIAAPVEACSNPYCNGISVEPRISSKKVKQSKVLILIVMEYL